MVKRSGLFVALTAGAAVSVAWAGPHNQPARKAQTGAKVASGYIPIDGPGFSDNFDSYAPGSGIIGQGGWIGWDLSAPNAFVDNTNAASAPNSLVSVFGTDVVQVFNLTTGKWIAKAKTYMPSGNSGIGYFIMLNTFSAPYVSGGNWSVQVDLNASAGVVISHNRLGNMQAPLIYDQWVEIVCTIDLDNDTLDITYGGQPLAVGAQWSWNVSGSPGQIAIQCLDLYSESAGFRWDDVSLLPDLSGACYANCDQSTTAPVLNVADFSCFLTKFAGGDNYANCDQSTTAPVLNVADFSCFLTKFAGGCP